jgi:hypothetical protein
MTGAVITLGWRRPDPAIVTQWRGPSGRQAPRALSVTLPQLAAIIGPPGAAGDRGPVGPPPDLSIAVIDGGTFM